MNAAHAASGYWNGGPDEHRIRDWVAGLRAQLGGRRPDLGLVFLTPAWFDRAADLLELLQVHGQTPLLLGCSSTGVIAGDQELEQAEGFALGLYSLPGATLRTTRFTQQQLDDLGDGRSWADVTGIAAGTAHGWLAFADPFNLDAEGWLRTWSTAYPGEPVLGGLASGDFTGQRTQVYRNGEVFEEGGIALGVGGEVALVNCLSQGCTPFGDTWTITRVDRNVIHEIGNRPAYEVLLETFNALPPDEQRRTRQNVFVGLVIDEYREEFHRGDFLIRNLLGADPRNGAIAVGALPRLGQTLQFQRRDGQTGATDLQDALTGMRAGLEGREILGGCLCSCNGRGSGLFGVPGHDAGAVSRELHPPGLTGFFANGEFGPVGRRNFVHGYTASLAMFVRRHAAPDPAT